MGRVAYRESEPLRGVDYSDNVIDTISGLLRVR